MLIGDGDLGVQRAPDEEPLEFAYFGETIRVDPTYTDADLVDHMEIAQSLDSKDPRAVTLVKEMLKATVHPDDFERFWALGKQHRQTMEDRMGVHKAVTEAVTDRPTSRPGSSSSGPSTTPPSSEDGSLSRVLSRHEGRRDLQLVIADTATARAAAGGLSAAS